MSAAEEAFYDDFTAPMQRAAVRLALTPPPDLEALLAKLRVMHEQELDELGSMSRPELEVLAEDEGRLSACGGPGEARRERRTARFAALLTSPPPHAHG